MLRMTDVLENKKPLHPVGAEANEYIRGSTLLAVKDRRSMPVTRQAVVLWRESSPQARSSRVVRHLQALR